MSTIYLATKHKRQKRFNFSFISSVFVLFFIFISWSNMWGEKNTSICQSSRSCTLSTQQSLHYFIAVSGEGVLSFFPMLSQRNSSASHVGQETVILLVSLPKHQKYINVTLFESQWGFLSVFFIFIIWIQRGWMKGLVKYKLERTRKKDMYYKKDMSSALCDSYVKHQ